MICVYIKAPNVQSQLRDGPAGPFLDGFAQDLRDKGYGITSGRSHLQSAAHLGIWMDQRNLRLTSLDDESIRDFRRHLASCACSRVGGKKTNSVAVGAALFLDYLRRKGIAGASPAKDGWEDEQPMMRGFGQWMLQRRGVTHSTLQVYGRVVRRLVEHLGDDPALFTAAGLRLFILDFTKSYSRHSAKVAVTAVRMFVRYLVAEEYCAVGLDAAVPTVAEWRLSTLPRYLRAPDVERIIAACDPATSVGARDRAIVVLIWRLGLRAGDVAALCLQDIDWHAASLRVVGKGRRSSRLPLPQDVGDAILHYLEQGRQPLADNHVFLRAIAPWGPLKRYGVSDVVDRAIRRAGVSAPSRGAHVLRHSAATELLRQGCSLQGIAAVLRHRSIETTAHYAKVDVTMLREIAQPWPEVLS